MCVWVLAAVAATASVGGSLMQAQQARQAASYNAQVAQVQGQAQQQQAEYSAQLAEGEAVQARQVAGQEEAARRERSRFLLADQRARFLSSGLQLEGSPLEVLAFNAGQYELDALAARYDGQVRAQAQESEASARRYGGQVARMAGVQGAGTALLAGQTAAAQAYGQAFQSATRFASSGEGRQAGKTVASWFG